MKDSPKIRGLCHNIGDSALLNELTGTVEIEVSDGELRTLATGKAGYLEEAGSKGHTLRVVGDEPATFFIVEVE